ncbi:MAG: IS1595 family transposase, partial [Holosporaceae bacterium]|nr:IS1595 family transposase [Holosporaceae bacterium]
MSKKNRYIRRAHISGAKFREILRLFGADLTATQ